MCQLPRINVDSTSEVEVLDLVELEDITADPSVFGAELLLFGSVLLRSFDTFYRPSASIEYNNDRASHYVPFFCENITRGWRDILQKKGYVDEVLPDVCGACYHSFGLTVAGRYRYGCPHCNNISHNAWHILDQMQRACPNGEINRAILAQLIYKYYSSNGDAAWAIVIPRLLTS